MSEPKKMSGARNDGGQMPPIGHGPGGRMSARMNAEKPKNAGKTLSRRFSPPRRGGRLCFALRQAEGGKQFTDLRLPRLRQGAAQLQLIGRAAACGSAQQFSPPTDLIER